MLYKRDIIDKIDKVILKEEYIIISGARQTGKTSILLMLKRSLENEHDCHYFNLENPDYLKLLNKHPFNIFELIPDNDKKQYIFIDEIQYLDNPTQFLKLLFDEKREKIKIIASGSSSFYIDKKFKDSLSGRKFLFELFTLNFDEFLVFSKKDELLNKKNEKLSKYYQEEIAKLWQEYLLYGGYPKVVLSETDEMKRINIEEIGASYIKKDLSDAGVKNQDKYFALIKILAGQTGQLVNSQELANTLNIARKTVEEYLYIMEKSYHLTFVKPFYRNMRKELTKMPKVYFNDLGLRNFLLSDFSRPISKRNDHGAYIENIAFREFKNKEKGDACIKFWRTQDKKEIDFIIGKNAFEIKAGIKNDHRKYQSFIDEYKDIKFNFLTFEKFIEYFYGFSI